MAQKIKFLKLKNQVFKCKNKPILSLNLGFLQYFRKLFIGRYLTTICRLLQSVTVRIRLSSNQSQLVSDIPKIIKVESNSWLSVS